MAEYEDEVHEETAFGDVMALTSHSRVGGADTLRLHEAPSWARLFSDIATDIVELSDTVTALVGAVVMERLNLVESFAISGTFGVTYAESLQFLDAGGIAREATVIDELLVSEETVLSRGIQVIDQLALTETITGAAKYGLSWVDGILLTDRILRFIGGDVTETLELTPIVDGQQRAYRTAADNLELVETIAPRFLLSAVASDDLELSAEQVIQMLFQPHMREDILLTGAYISPGGGFTAWSMNTRTAAVTEYTDFEFNSFVRIGNKYIGASSEGLFELNGDTDDGDDIIAQIKGGYLQFGGVKLSRLKAAYIAARGDGEFVLRIITGDDSVYNYAATTRDMLTSKVHMGKGQRARYFAFELISAGQDFDLDSIEFVPIVVQRRV
jgi:hypothetical protein